MLYIFDWDGTLSDSTAKIVACMQFAARDVDLPVLDDESIKNIIGLGLPEAIYKLYPDISEAGIIALRDAYSRNFLREDAKPSEFFPGVLPTLQALRDSGAHLSVATGKSRRGLDRVLARLQMTGFFHATRCADETASKPQPLMLQELLQAFSVDAGDAVMVGDTEYDMAMAQEISMPKIAVSYGAHHIDRLRPYQPALCVDHFPDILAYANR